MFWSFFIYLSFLDRFYCYLSTFFIYFYIVQAIFSSNIRNQFGQFL